MDGFKILMAATAAGFFFPAAQHPTQHKEPQTPQGGLTCSDSKLYLQAQHC
jgi:hypothetical protein